MAEKNAGNVRKIIKKNGLPALLAGLVWPLWAILFPLYKFWHMLVATILCLTVYFITLAVCKDKEIVEEIPPVKTGDEEADRFLEECRSQIDFIRTEKSKIGSASVVAKISGIEDTVAKILEFVEKKPAAARRLRRFMNYYLPTLAKLIDTYEDLEREGNTGENAAVTMDKIDGMLDMTADAFKRQLDALYGDVALDVSTDISVMEQLMAREGLRSEEPKQ